MLPAALTQYPQANASWLYDGSALVLGAQTAIENAGRATGANRLVVIAGTSACGEPGLIRAGWDIGCDAYSDQWDGWQSMDFVNRLFAGQKASRLPTVGVGLQIIDATHNLPKGTAWVPPINFEAGYEKVWKGKWRKMSAARSRRLEEGRERVSQPVQGSMSHETKTSHP